MLVALLPGLLEEAAVEAGIGFKDKQRSYPP